MTIKVKTEKDWVFYFMKKIYTFRNYIAQNIKQRLQPVTRAVRNKKIEMSTYCGMLHKSYMERNSAFMLFHKRTLIKSDNSNVFVLDIKVSLA